jgi:hypothetical protein
MKNEESDEGAGAFDTVDDLWMNLSSGPVRMKKGGRCSGDGANARFSKAVNYVPHK